MTINFYTSCHINFLFYFHREKKPVTSNFFKIQNPKLNHKKKEKEEEEKTFKV